MNVINRKSKEVIESTAFKLKHIYVTMEEYRLYFTGGAVCFCELKAGEYVHFLNDGVEWRFYCNDDPDGFQLTPIRSKPGLHLTSAGLINMIRKSTGFKTGRKSFIIEKTGAMHDRCEVFRLEC